MKKYVCILLILVLSMLFTACGMVQYQSNDYHFKLSFPDDMVVFAPGEVDADDPNLEKYGFTAEDLEAFHAQGGIYYAVSNQGDVYREITVTVEETSLSQEIWQLKEGSTYVSEVQDDMIETYNIAGIEVLQKGEFKQGDAYCVFVNVSSGNVDGIDAINLLTICNGLKYSVLYQSTAPITEAEELDVHDIFNTFYITELVADPNEEPRDTTVTKAVLVVVILLIIAALAVLIIRMIGVHRHKEEDEQPYVPQFEDSFNKTKNQKDKK